MIYPVLLLHQCFETHDSATIKYSLHPSSRCITPFQQMLMTSMSAPVRLMFVIAAFRYLQLTGTSASIFICIVMPGFTMIIPWPVWYTRLSTSAARAMPLSPLHKASCLKYATDKA
jgi:hypothetical protein